MEKNKPKRNMKTIIRIGFFFIKNIIEYQPFGDLQLHAKILIILENPYYNKKKMMK
jgi:hypothetical protein